jgi:hypothetical protein
MSELQRVTVLDDVNYGEGATRRGPKCCLSWLVHRGFAVGPDDDLAHRERLVAQSFSRCTWIERLLAVVSL